MELNVRAMTEQERRYMSVGSMCGWGVLGADPKIYDENGLPVKSKMRERGGSR